MTQLARETCAIVRRAQLVYVIAGVGVLASALALGVPACGTGGEESNGGMVGLPGAGLGPFRRLDTGEVSGRLGVRRMALVARSTV